MTTKTSTFPTMGTMASITIKSPTPDKFNAIIEKSFETLDYFNKSYSPYRSNSSVSLYNRGVYSQQQLSERYPHFEEIFKLSEEAAQETGGLFTSWIPKEEDLSKPLYNPTGLVKGYALQNIEKNFRGLKEMGYLINIGGDIAVGGDMRYLEMPWNIKVENPQGEHPISYNIELFEGAVATSGNYIRGNHIYNPFTNKFMKKDGSLTVIGSNILWSDIWATALFVGDEEDIHFFKEKTNWRVISQ